MITRMLRITCDQCGASSTVNTGDVLEGERIIEKKGWAIHDYGYGNSGHFCDDNCRGVHLERLQLTGTDHGPDGKERT